MKLLKKMLRGPAMAPAPADGEYEPGTNGLPPLASPAPLNTKLVVVAGKVRMLKTVLGGDLLLGWDTCHGCAQHVAVHTCASITASPWIVRQSGYVQEPVYATEKVWVPIRRDLAPAARQREAGPAEQAVSPAPVPTLAELNAAAKDEAGDAVARLRKRLARATG